METNNYEAAIEAILFTMGESVEIDKIAKALELTKAQVKKIVGNMQKETVPDRVFHSDISKDQSGSHCKRNLCKISVHESKGK